MLKNHEREMKKYTLPIALFSILIATRIQAAGSSLGLTPVGASMFMTVIYAIIISLVLAAGVYGLVYWRRKRKKG
ncbi:hypothetical protein E3J85_00530 [Patescibacteria group bacterium]|nr:MAG: hypothetical protein E3J85_00530 [Patescibacteria group bacterium]